MSHVCGAQERKGVRFAGPYRSLFFAAVTAIWALSISSPGSAERSPIEPYRPPDAGWVTVHVAPPTPPSQLLQGSSNLFWRRGRESLRWALFVASHGLDDAASVTSAIRTGSEIGAIVDLRSVPERRCAGRAWWFRWRVRLSSPASELDHRELVFENNGRESLIDYTSDGGKAIDGTTMASILSYCAKFNI